MILVMPKQDVDAILRGRPPECQRDVDAATLETLPDGSRKFDVASPEWATMFDRWKIPQTPEVRERAAKWAAARDSWEDAHREEQYERDGFFVRLKSFAQSKASRLAGRVKREKFDQRVQSCHGDPCGARAYSQVGTYHYCDLCGCGDRESAAVSLRGSAPDHPRVDYDGPYTKLHYPKLRCPLGRPGFSNAVKYKTVILNCDAHGWGDAVVGAWISEGSKDAHDARLLHYATGDRKLFLEMLGQPVRAVPDGAVTTWDAYQAELAERGSVPRALSRAKFLGITATPKRPGPLRVPKPAEDWAEKFSRDRRARNGLVLLFPQAEYACRRWPASYWVDLAWTLKEQGYETVTVMGRVEEQYCNVPLWINGHSWHQVAALMTKSSAVVGNDSGPVHLAGTIGVPTFALVGPTNPAVFSHVPEVRVVRDESLSCVGCHWDPLKYRAACDQTCRSMMRLEPERVAAEVRSCL
jgi:hypothetical protein